MASLRREVRAFRSLLGASSLRHIQAPCGGSDPPGHRSCRRQGPTRPPNFNRQGLSMLRFAMAAAAAALPLTLTFGAIAAGPMPMMTEAAGLRWAPAEGLPPGAQVAV